MNGPDFLFSPNSQAYEAGQRIRSDNLKNEGLDLQNQMDSARVPGLQGISMQQQAVGQRAQGGLQNNMELDHSDFMSKMDDNQLKQIQDFGEKAGQLGTVLGQVPAPLRTQALPALASKFGVDLNSPEISQLLQRAGPDGMGQALTTMGTGIATSSAKAINDRIKQQSINDTNLESHRIGAKASVDAAGVRADASEASATIRATAQLKVAEEATKRMMALSERKATAALSAMKPDQRWVYLNKIPKEDRTEAEQGEFERLTEHGYTLASLKNPSLAPQVMNGDDVTTPLQNAGAAARAITGAGSVPVTETLAHYKQLYAGKGFSDEQLKAAYKKKTGKELK